ncbi:LacI family DNA-binding transcriptional regulator [Pelagicoccus sp. SDUM812005]|uniref:LacI family DNA-binding transcriptional regulator n=1 Tax=Pelagicoccus sp. SDUM812005 TaxID=3041257 RepID=UPI00280CFB84|nr:LacI family DNA-binding transcriptional regulator [Pelagicoccus sp. SDUM812005]MDQ8179398.1 LacI family DNA-binding transcriptional regulator [Pelagicoccus sp. SDUM812005]
MTTRKKSSRATIADVARKAEVAIGTVSRVFNNHPDVNEDIRNRVNDAVNELGYVRLRNRKRPRESSDRRVGNIGLVFFGMEDTLVQLPIVSSAVHGIERALATQGYNLMLANIPNGDRTPHFISDQHIEGLILKGPNQGILPSEAKRSLLSRFYSIPYVWLMGRLPNAVGDHCNYDTEEAGRIVAEHLDEKGHRRTAFLNPKPGQIQFERMKASFTQHSIRLGHQTSTLEVDPPTSLEWPLPSITLQNNVDVLVERWMQLPKDKRPTALFVPSDRTAVQAYAAFAQRDLKVGEDVSIISCNNEKPLLANMNPALTTIDVHAEVIGQRAVDQLIWRIGNPNQKCHFQNLVEPTLVPGDSVKQL